MNRLLAQQIKRLEDAGVDPESNLLVITTPHYLSWLLNERVDETGAPREWDKMLLDQVADGDRDRFEVGEFILQNAFAMGYAAGMDKSDAELREARVAEWAAEWAERSA